MTPALRSIALGSALVLLAVGAHAQPAVDVPLGGPEGFGAIRLAAVGGVEADLSVGADGATVAFRKTLAEPRLLALEAECAGLPEGAKSVELSYTLSLDEGCTAAPAVAFWEEGGACWFRTSASPARSGEPVAQRVGVTGLRLASFSEDESGSLEWASVRRVWVGVVVDGAGEGSLILTGARLTSEPFVAAGPLRLPNDGLGVWTIGKDPAAGAGVTTPEDGPDGRKCTRISFAFPGGRHMYMIPSCPVSGEAGGVVEGYSALRLTYKAKLPPGVTGLLLMVGEHGGQFMAEPAPPATDEWTTLTVPFSDFVLGGWSKDDNGRLDPEHINQVMIGVHGTATVEEGDGVIWFLDVELAP